MPRRRPPRRRRFKGLGRRAALRLSFQPRRLAFQRIARIAVTLLGVGVGSTIIVRSLILRSGRLGDVNSVTLERDIYIYAHKGESKTDEIVVPIIDGTPFYKMVDDRSPGLALSFVAPPSLHWLGAPTYQEMGRAVILDGSCGFAECCGVLARIVVTDDAVRWSDFFARGHLPLPPGLGFEFDRAAYEATVEAVNSSPERICTVTDDD
jgi:hypothetical protein